MGSSVKASFMNPEELDPAAPLAAPSGRLEVERVEAGQVIGWSADLSGQAAHVEWWIDGVLTEFGAGERQHRLDVCTALGVGPENQHGFVMALPFEIWADQGRRTRDVRLRSAGMEATVVLPASLSSLVQSLQALADGPPLWAALRRVDAHVIALGGFQILTTEAARWLQASLGRCSVTEAVERRLKLSAGQGAVFGLVEALDGLCVLGWAWSGDGTTERIELLVDGKREDSARVRTQRDDVQRAMGSARSSLGFELEIPGRVWALSRNGALRLQIEVDGQVLPGQVLELSSAQLLGVLDRVREVQRAWEAGAEGIDPKEQQYRVLLLLEHVDGAGLMSELDTERLAFIRSQAERFGLTGLFRGALALGSAARGAAPVHDHTTILVWRLLKQFNERAADASKSLASHLDELLSSSPVQGEALNRFLLSLIPCFCDQQAYSDMRRWLPPGRVRALVHSSNAWELSLALPELAATGDLTLAAQVVEKLAKGAPGWLNTECIAHSVRELQRQSSGLQQLDTPALAMVGSLLSLVESVGANAWGRGHDRHLIDSVVTLVALCPSLTDEMVERVARNVWAVYALVPAFWQSLRKRLPDQAQWPRCIEEAQSILHALQGLLADESRLQPTQVLRSLPLLHRLRLEGNLDSSQVTRELVLALLARVSEEGPEEAVSAELSADLSAICAELEALSPSDPLRAHAHPVAASLGSVSAPLLRERVHAVTGIPRAPHAAQLRRVVGLLRARSPESVSVADCRLLAGRRGRFVGLHLMAVRWCMLRTARTLEASSADLSELREMWMQGLESTLTDRVRPAALISALACLRREQAREPDSSLALVLEEFESRAGDVLPALLPRTPEAPPTLAVSSPWASSLLVIYSCRGNLPTRVQMIRESWARSLTARGIAWVVVVGNGDDTLDGDVLRLAVSDSYEDLPQKSLALIKWVHDHTDFDCLIKIDDDCHFAVDEFFDSAPHLTHHYLGRRLHRAEGGTERAWHQSKSASARGRSSIDKSPEPSVYADGGAGYVLSRWAMSSVLQVLQTTAGARLCRSAFMEDKLIGDLLAHAGIELSSEGYETLVRRRYGVGATPVNAHQNVFYPGPASPTLVSHLDDFTQIGRVESAMHSTNLRPPRIWPTHATPLLGGAAGTNQLELLSDPEKVRRLEEAKVLVIAVARNEAVLLPHFLAHYRRLGVRHFVLADNLSDDGSREFLLAQPDVVLYSVDTEYRHSHYGVAWQQAILGAHALGKWVVLADIDEFLVYPDCENVSLSAMLDAQSQQGHDALLTLMIDMYPKGDLADADFTRQPPFEVARYFDRAPLIKWRLGGGCYSNATTYLSALRHRAIADSAPNLYTSQKLAVFKYAPWVRLAEGLHYASNLSVAPRPVYFAHFKYHAGFQEKVRSEVERKQHFNGAEEYRKYLAMIDESQSQLYGEGVSVAYESSHSFSSIAV
ncbi:glycosyltransferase family 2 protein [Ideonella sp.]|uniref:glycosyltransferase family 2 protein n=1 Tax=Ideonella sp. TaxID=1929293 RepID=UPI003BB63888